MTNSDIDSHPIKVVSTKKPRCSHCGACCLKQGSGFTMTRADFRRWKDEQREDILRYIPLHDRQVVDHDVWIDWVDPDSHEYLAYCPFLRMGDHRAYACAINETKPHICSSFWCEWAYGAGRRGKPVRSSGKHSHETTPVT